ncbi:MAG: DUF3299 domain-containing protein [Pseudomonadota bacterium]
MRLVVKSGLLMASLFFAASILPAAEPQEIDWDDLLPEEREYDDPFFDLNYEQIYSLSQIYRVESLVGDTATPEEIAEAKRLRVDLEEQGLDPDWLFQQRLIVMEERERAARETNAEIIGERIRMPGYLLPLELVDQKAVEFLLVPTVGACIHVPAPPPNQIIHVRFEQGFAVDGLYEPVWVSGTVEGEATSSALYFVDGEALVDTSYAMQAVMVEPYE